MSLDLSQFTLSTESLSLLWGAISGDVRVHHVESYARVLTKMLTEAAELQPLFVSIGTGDFLAPWLTQLYEKDTVRITGKQPIIKKLVIKRLALPLIDKLTALNLVEPDFKVRIEKNSQLLQQDPGLKRAGVAVEMCEWAGMAPFHGYLYGAQCLIGPWMVNTTGHLHVQTLLFETHQRSAPERYATIQRYFGQV